MTRIENALVENGRLKFPLYHSTSSLFRDSILEHGLGGRNPILELKALDLLQRLVEYEKVHPLKDGLWFYLENMAQQITTAGANWQHGQVYLTSSKNKTSQYAKFKYGSELITETLNLYIKLGSPPTMTVDEFPVLTLLESNPHPVCFRLNSIPTERLAGEKGESIQSVLTKTFKILESFIKEYPAASNSELLKEIEACGLCFRLLHPVQIKTQAEQIWAVS